MGCFNSIGYNVFETGLTQNMMIDCIYDMCIPDARHGGGPYGTDHLVYSPSAMTLEKCFKLCLMNNFNYSAITQGFANYFNKY